MKIFIYIIIAVSAGLLIFNLTKLNFDALFVGESSIAAISVLASACAIVLMLILLTSKKISKKSLKR